MHGIVAAFLNVTLLQNHLGNAHIHNKYVPHSLTQPPTNFKIDMKKYYIISHPGHGSSVFSCQILHECEQSLYMSTWDNTGFKLMYCCYWPSDMQLVTVILFLLLRISQVSRVYNLHCTYASSTHVSSSCTTVTQCQLHKVPTLSLPNNLIYIPESACYNMDMQVYIDTPIFQQIHTYGSIQHKRQWCIKCIHRSSTPVSNSCSGLVQFRLQEDYKQTEITDQLRRL